MSAAETPLPSLFQAHRQGLAGAVRSVLGARTDATEVLQDAFLKCWRHWQRGERPDDPVAWIFVVVWNTARDARRARERRPVHQTLDEERTVLTTTQPSPPQALLQREAVSAAQAAVAGLGEAEQQVFLLRVSAGLSFEAAAGALGIPVGTAKTRMRSALQKLRRQLGADEQGRKSEEVRR
ncbi:MAG: sigma-70 family RNA polymerase sigma factor [Planctomycetes bacterium]|nr:sigma-70 family RNA polymerase sigma factor [Planctomycetota bacterium]MCB9884664.1 sigma-70 family RNA polymerase sigma factor [Planctomycetota bacterium]